MSEYCKECEDELFGDWLDCEDGPFCNRHCAKVFTLKDRIAELESPWIPVSEPPDESGRYLCCIVDRDEGLTDVLFASFSRQEWVTLAYQEITHWMKLPEPPDRENTNE